MSKDRLEIADTHTPHPCVQGATSSGRAVTATLIADIAYIGDPGLLLIWPKLRGQAHDQYDEYEESELLLRQRRCLS